MLQLRATVLGRARFLEYTCKEWLVGYNCAIADGNGRWSSIYAWYNMFKYRKQKYVDLGIIRNGNISNLYIGLMNVVRYLTQNLKCDSYRHSKSNLTLYPDLRNMNVTSRVGVMLYAMSWVWLMIFYHFVITSIANVAHRPLTSHYIESEIIRISQILKINKYDS